ncbi:Fis family transcriptional regulator [Kineosporia sp. NBRC 101731]|uniref:Fis family transcriptional regulator n=1 Tax=Kineosporia sp. NBRC 101731 TaxID=3032199 RepID=UPI0025557807|nr:Fis family transcriptional regulator [Kineosporia sp. NBRC 101731]
MTTSSVIIRELTVTDPAVVTEALRWSTGRRGEAITASEMTGADLSRFVNQALLIGAHAITSAGGTQEKFDLERLVSEVGTRTSEATTRAAEATSETVTQVADTLQKVSEETKKQITQASEQTRKAFSDNVDEASKALRAEIQRLVGGEQPELVDRLAPLLEAFGQKLDTRSTEQTQTLLAKAARQFDPTDPTSPMAKHTKALQEQQVALNAELEKNHLALVAKVDELTTAVKVSTSAKESVEKLAKVTPLKGDTYADAVHQVMEEIAGGLGDEYTNTGATVGVVARSKKGDGVLVVNGGLARLVLEMSDSNRTAWNDYLDEAERNREAAASLGLVPSTAQNGGHSIRCIGSRRIVMAFEPSTDDPQLLRTVVQILRVAAISASSRRDVENVQTAEEKITEALGLLMKIDEIHKAAGTIRKGADKIEGQCSTIQTGLNRLLTQAQGALAGLAQAEGESVEVFGTYPRTLDMLNPA